ncbi:MAG: hypothetical protein PHW03_02405 [Eubacteriales bacterium]|nr:hypothetical protein [Eubacteriales bacterium]MDD4389634.1 hypothetical protein [Eubacteriales bacterium]
MGDDRFDCGEKECMKECKDRCYKDCYCEEDNNNNIFIWILVILLILFLCNGNEKGGLFGGLF